MRHSNCLWMTNRLGMTVALALGFAIPASAADSNQLFTEMGHDFGLVPRAAKVEHVFVMHNPYNQPLHIAAVRTSCGCTMPRAEKDTIPPHGQGGIVAEFNTRAFTGQHGATVIVVIDQPFYTEVRLNVRGYIRTDVVLDPSEVNFGTVDEGAAAERKFTLDYAGRPDWKLVDVKSGLPGVTAACKETRRGGGRCSYEITVKLADNAPAGYLRDELTLVTNDNRTPQFGMVVEGRIVPELAVSPSTLMLGIVQPGQTVKRQLVIRAKRPFKVVGLSSTGAANPDVGTYTFGATQDEAKAVHLVPVTFTAGKQPGKLAQHIRIETDLGAHGTAEIQVLGEVSSPLAGK